MRRVTLTVLLLLLPPATPAWGMRRVVKPWPGPGSRPAAEAAIADTWPDQLQRQALDVAWCESRGDATAKNRYGFKGLFQMGAREFRKYGSGNDIFDAHDNAAAAFRYYVDAGGWRPWECQPRNA